MASLFEADIASLKGVGPKRAELFRKLGAPTVGDLLRLYPRAYEDWRDAVPIRNTLLNEVNIVKGTVLRRPVEQRIRGGMTLYKTTITDGEDDMQLTFFNNRYITSLLTEGAVYAFRGKVTGTFMRREMASPEFVPESRMQDMVPVYPQTSGLTSRIIANAVKEALRLLPETVKDPLPDALRLKYALCRLEYALKTIHFPNSPEALSTARRRLVFEELLVLQLGMAEIRRAGVRENPYPLKKDYTKEFAALLPFTMTGAQQRAVDDICADVRTGRPMSRLVQGDVGSGKTMVAAAAACLAAKNGVQTALLAPTEILARQHYDRLAPLFEGLGIRTVLLTGQMGAAQKRSAREAAELGLADVVIGTHALLTEQTRFARLGMVIADEQHRFGVAQRAALCAKGTQPHLLLLSATPIPRTLALIVYGDLDVSVVDELPPGREPVETFLVDERYRARLNAFVRKQAAEGHQSFIVCPAVEDDGGDGGETLKAAEQWARTLQDYVFPNLRVALLHGKMKGAEKEAVMASFAAGEADILVATTVIEVGVDVPNATLMVIENADRFGLSQLHQLRGRVGRGSAKAWCVLVSDNKNPETRQRLRTLCGTNDGFRIAEADLQQRGPGDFFGSRQHGLPVFRVGDLATDLAVLRQAQEAAAQLISQDRPLPSPLAQAIESLLAGSADTLN